MIYSGYFMTTFVIGQILVILDYPLRLSPHILGLFIVWLVRLFKAFSYYHIVSLIVQRKVEFAWFFLLKLSIGLKEGRCAFAKIILGG
jgi:hypothetical protein